MKSIQVEVMDMDLLQVERALKASKSKGMSERNRSSFRGIARGHVQSVLEDVLGSEVASQLEIRVKGKK